MSEPTALIHESTHGNFVSPIGYLNDDPSFGTYEGWAISTLDDRRDGKESGLFETEQQLAIIRGQCHRLYNLAQPAKTAVEILTNYTFGSGFVVKAQPAAGYEDSDAAKQLAARCNRVIREFMDLNDWEVEVESEVNRRVRRDGELFVVLSWHDGGIAMRFAEPQMICEPANKRLIEEDMLRQCPDLPDVPYSFSFGIVTPENDVANVVGYHVQWTDSPTDGEFIPAWRMMHIKSRDTDRNVKRGVSEFEVIRQDLIREAKLRGNTAEGAALQAAIAYVVEYPLGTTQQNVQSQITQVAGGTVPKQTIGGTVREKSVMSSGGTRVIHTPQGKQYKAGPLGSDRCGDFLAVAQYLMRSCAARWCIPEFMFSSDASNANYSSTMVAESPFVAAREHDQRWFVRQFRKLFWKVLRMALAASSLRARTDAWDQLQEMVEVEITPPQVHTTNRAEQHAILAGQYQAGVISRRTWRETAELDNDIEERNIAEERAKYPQPPAMPSGFESLFRGASSEGLSESLADRVIAKVWESYP